MEGVGGWWMVEGFGGVQHTGFWRGGGGVGVEGGLATLGLIPIPVSNRAEHLTGN